MNRELLKRIIVVTAGVPVIFGATLLGKLPFFIFVNIILVVSLLEFYGLSKSNDVIPSQSLGLLSILAISWDIYMNNGIKLPVIISVTILFVLIAELFKKRGNHLNNTGATLLGVLYISLFSSFLFLHKLSMTKPEPLVIGPSVVLMIFISIWICDTSAYLFGSRIGRTPLFPRISPKKTWEGSIIGFILAVITAIGFKLIFIPHLFLIDSIVCGIVVGIVGQISDLIESMFKRDAQVKDSSKILPGHGGVMDRFDSPILIGPVLILYFLLRNYHF